MKDYSHTEFREALHDLGLSDRQAAAMLGVTEQQIRRLKMAPDKGGHRQVSATVARLIDAYRYGYRPGDWPLVND